MSSDHDLFNSVTRAAPLDGMDASLLETALMYVEQDELDKAVQHIANMSEEGVIRSVRNLNMLAPALVDLWLTKFRGMGYVTGIVGLTCKPSQGFHMDPHRGCVLR